LFDKTVLNRYKAKAVVPNVRKEAS
jgi:hypothetical protein